MVRKQRLFRDKDRRRKEPPPPEQPVIAKAPEEAPAAPAAAPPPDDGQPVEFDEEWYLSRYPDVARAVSAGLGRSGLQHYLIHGRKEGRLPVPPKREA